MGNDFIKSFFYIYLTNSNFFKQAEKDGWHSPDFWYYLGISVYYRGNKSASKRYLERGFYKFGCTDCNDAYELLFGKRLKF